MNIDEEFKLRIEILATRRSFHLTGSSWIIRTGFNYKEYRVAKSHGFVAIANRPEKGMTFVRSRSHHSLYSVVKEKQFY